MLSHGIEVNIYNVCEGTIIRNENEMKRYLETGTNYYEDKSVKTNLVCKLRLGSLLFLMSTNLILKFSLKLFIIFNLKN